MVNTSPPNANSSTPNGENRSDMDAAKQAAANGLNDLKREAREDLRGITETARRDFEEARRAAGHYAEDRKNDAVDQVGSLAAAVRRMADDLERGDSPMIGRYARDLGDGLEHLVEQARSRSINEMMHDVERFGRERPGVFLVGAALLGFAASRFLAASAERDHREGHNRDWRDEETHRPSAPALNAGMEDL